MKNYKSFYEQVYSQDFNVNNIPYGWIQWKGTDVCMDMYCKCGYHGHMDTDFLYHYECPKCKTKYAVGQNIKLIELTSEQSEEVTRRSNFKTCTLKEDDEN